MSDKTHYTVVIEVTHTDYSKPDQGRVREPIQIDEKRTVREVSRLVIRADSIDALKEKATAHLDLMEDY